MTAMDPAEQRAKRLRRAGDRRFLVGAVAVAAVMSACAALLGLAIAATAEMMRHFAIDSVFDDRVGIPMFWGVGTIGYLWALGMAGTLFGSITASWLIDLYRGGEGQPRILASLVACAVAVAVVADAPTWMPPLEVGVESDPVFHEDAAWSVFGWIAYFADIWVPCLVVLIAGLVVAYAIRHYGRLREQIADRNRLLAEGRRTEGVVTRVAARITVNDQGQRSTVGYVITVRYTDTHGIERNVTRFARGRDSTPASNTVEVLFDPRRPGEDHLVFVSIHPDPVPAEWLGPEL
jgi:hypothetical protein